jgi:hypothetical protein
MKQAVLGLLVAALSVTLVRADVAVPPPKGKKFVAMKHTITLSSDISGYVFFTRTLGIRNGEFTKIELTSSKTHSLTGFGKFGMELVAVPEAVAKKYASEKELVAALATKLEGVSSARFQHTGLLPEKDPRKEMTLDHVVTGFDAKTGIKMTENGDAPKTPEKEEESTFAPTSPALAMSGLAVGAAFVTGGLWFVRRRRVS